MATKLILAANTDVENTTVTNIELKSPIDTKMNLKVLLALWEIFYLQNPSESILILLYFIPLKNTILCYTILRIKFYKGETIMYYTWNELFWIFFSYSFVGWCAGVITNAFRRKKFVNTGFLNLPLCPIYGIIGIAYGIFLPELRNRLFFLFLGGCIIALLLIWDYSKIPFNLGGRINLLFCFFWGIAAVVWLKILYPKFSGWIEQIPVKVGKSSHQSL